MTQPPLTGSIDAIRDKLVQLRAQHTEGALADAAYDQSRAALEQQLLDAVLADPQPPLRPDGNGVAATQSPRIAFALAVILLAGGVVYWWKMQPAISAPTAAQATAGPTISAADNASRPAATMPGTASATVAGARTVGGTVTISKSMAALAKPDDAVFIFAREAGGSRMPLAIIKRHVRDLPVTFTLDDRTSMSPTKKLSDVSKVIVGARVSKRDNPIPEKGDLSGLSDAVAVGTSDVRLEIREPYQQQ
jgi:cytochrome c-type biogenesis protein CcmI